MSGPGEGYYDSESDPYAKATIDASPDEIDVKNIIIPNALAPGETGIFDKVFEIAKLNKEDYRLVDDSVRFSTWNQSANIDGRRDLITLYSYKCKFVRVTERDKETEELIGKLHDRIASSKSTRRAPGTGLGAPVSYTFLASDWQLGKPEVRKQDLHLGRTGVEQTVARVERSVGRALEDIARLRSNGVNITSVSVGFMGDPTENVSDSYPNQQYLVELNLFQQIRLAMDLGAMVLEELLPLSDDPANVFGVLCNHGQFARRNTKVNVTDDEDNIQNLLLTIWRERIVGPNFPGTHWYLPGKEMITTLDIAGVKVAAAHGHKIPSGAAGEWKWLNSQAVNLADKRDHRPELWLTAHRHSHDAKDYGPFHRLQAGTADGGSKHFEDMSGGYSTPGTSVALIGHHDERKYSHFELL